MLMYLLPKLSSDSEARLRELQARVNSQGDKRAKYQLASHLFRNKQNRAFSEVKAALAYASPPGRACYYCERDRYRDVEHIKPKRHYPEFCFEWANYVFTCTICNQDEKGDRYGIIQNDGQLIEFDRSWPDDSSLPDGQHAFLDIRSEDPLEYLILDFETGRFVPVDESGIARQRAIYTRDLLQLDSDDLSRARRQAAAAYTNYLQIFAEAKEAGLLEEAHRILDEVLELPHPTVFAEMLRQKGNHARLSKLLDALPADFPLHRYIRRKTEDSIEANR